MALRHELKLQEFIERVAERARIADRFEAEKTAVVVLQALSDRLTGKEARDLLAQLPAMFKELVVISPSAQPLSADEFVGRVSDDLDVPEDEARARIRAVFATLREAVTRGQFEDVLAQLDPEYADLLA
ncbi:MAG: DUF2267 domain-containing protein [Gaiellaceae bacterium]